MALTIYCSFATIQLFPGEIVLHNSRHYDVDVSTGTSTTQHSSVLIGSYIFPPKWSSWLMFETGSWLFSYMTHQILSAHISPFYISTTTDHTDVGHGFGSFHRIGQWNRFIYWSVQHQTFIIYPLVHWGLTLRYCMLYRLKYSHIHHNNNMKWSMTVSIHKQMIDEI